MYIPIQGLDALRLIFLMLTAAFAYMCMFSKLATLKQVAHMHTSSSFVSIRKIETHRNPLGLGYTR
jgi:hypothetical protein